MILQLYAPSKHCWCSLSFTLASPHTTKAKKPILLFLLVKNFIYDLWLVRCSFLICEENHLTYQNLCSSLQINFFFSDLAWSKSQYIYYRPTCIHTHFKNFGPCKTLPFSKYTTKGTLMANGVGYHNHICIKLKTGQVNRQFIHVGNWAKKSSITQPRALCSFFTWLRPGEKNHTQLS